MIAYNTILTSVKQGKRMSAGILVVTIVIVLTLVTSSIVLAASPHFIGRPQIVKNPNASLTANFKAAGLANIVTQAFLSSNGGTALLQCVNPAGNSPPPKQVPFGPLVGFVTTVTPRNGQITASAGIGPPPLPSASQICPNPNWSVQLIQLTYFNVVLHIQQNAVDILTFNFGNVDP